MKIIIEKKNWFRSTLIVIFLMTCVVTEKRKRQIFREQVLPALGGKIPEEAFKTDRLELNRLNKEGITVPDGVVLDARNTHKHTQHVQNMPEVIQVYLTPDGRYIPLEGRFHYNRAKAIDTTYVIRAPYSRFSGHNKHANSYFDKHQDFPRSQAYANFRQFIPIVPPSKPGIYKPVVTSLVFPDNANLLQETFVPTWNIRYWDSIYEPFDDYDIALFNSHQIIANYQGFLNKFHERSSRHVESHPVTNHRDQNFSPYIRKQELQNIEINPKAISYQNVKLNADDIISRYTNLTRIPGTGFMCNGRRGMFADVETNCQVFHDCSGWSKTSSLCPSGTAFSNVKKRCEWWNTVRCK